MTWPLMALAVGLNVYLAHRLRPPLSAMSTEQQSLDRYNDLDRRLNPGAAAAVPAAPATAPAAAVPAETPAGGAINASTTPTPPAAPAGGEPKPDEFEAYKQAYAKVKGQDFSGGIKAFNALWNAANTVTTLGSFTDFDQPQRVFMLVAMFSLMSIGAYAITTLTGLLASDQVMIYRESKAVKHMLDRIKDHLVLVGFTSVGRLVAEKARTAGSTVVVVTDIPDMAAMASAQGFLVVLRLSRSLHPAGTPARHERTELVEQEHDTKAEQPAEQDPAEPVDATRRVRDVLRDDDRGQGEQRQGERQREPEDVAVVPIAVRQHARQDEPDAGASSACPFVRLCACSVPQLFTTDES